MDNKKTDMYLQSNIGKSSGWSKYVPPEPHNSKVPTPTPMPVPMPAPDPGKERDDLHMVKNLDNEKDDMYHQTGMGDDPGWKEQELPEQHRSHMHIPPYMPSPTPIPVPIPTPDSGEKRTPFSARDSSPPRQDYSQNSSHMVLGMSYVPMQIFQDVYEAEEGFGRGTIFAELDYPFMGKGECRNDRA